MKNKIKLIFAATILTNGLHKNSFRSGVYFAGANIFNEMIKNPNLSVTLHCSLNKIEELKEYLKMYYPNTQFNIISDVPLNKISITYAKLKNLKQQYKEEKNGVKKLFIQMILIPYSLLINFMSIFQSVLIKKQDYDAFFSPFSEPPKCIQKNKNIKIYMMLHDAIPLLFPGNNRDAIGKHGWFTKITNSFSPDNCYFTNSEATKKDFLKYYNNINHHKIYTIPHACRNSFKQCDTELITKVKHKYNIPVQKKYVFSLCTIEPRKNLIRAVSTFLEFIKQHNIDDLYFVLGGGQWDKFMIVFEEELRHYDEYKDKIIKTGYIDDEDLPPLYSGAEWFVYTSQYEGFGVPPLEAMTSGCPVITSNNSSLPEVIGDAGIMIDWDSDEQHIQAYEKYYYNADLREENRKKGLERAKEFSWEKCANAITNIIMKDNINE